MHAIDFHYFQLQKRLFGIYRIFQSLGTHQKDSDESQTKRGKCNNQRLILAQISHYIYY